jgi:hypothetical protein
LTATSQPILKVYANIAPSAVIGHGWSHYQGTITSTRPATIDIFGAAYMTIGTWNILFDAFHNSVWCDGKSTKWDGYGHPMVNFTRPSVHVYLFYSAEDALNPAFGHTTTDVRLTRVNGWPVIGARRASDEKAAAP